MPEVESTAIARLEYDGIARELRVTFVTRRTYIYFGVSPDVYANFIRAPSKGQFFNAHIRDRYAFDGPRRA